MHSVVSSEPSHHNNGCQRKCNTEGFLDSLTRKQQVFVIHVGDVSGLEPILINDVATGSPMFCLPSDTDGGVLNTQLCTQLVQVDGAIRLHGAEWPASGRAARCPLHHIDLFRNSRSNGVCLSNPCSRNGPVHEANGEIDSHSTSAWAYTNEQEEVTECPAWLLPQTDQSPQL